MTRSINRECRLSAVEQLPGGAGDWLVTLAGIRDDWQATIAVGAKVLFSPNALFREVSRSCGATLATTTREDKRWQQTIMAAFIVRREGVA